MNDSDEYDSWSDIGFLGGLLLLLLIGYVAAQTWRGAAWVVGWPRRKWKGRK